MQKGCGCKTHKGGQCFTQFSRGHYEDMWDQCAVLSRHELDLVILGQIMANIYNEQIVGTRTKHVRTIRTRSNMAFFHHGRRICKVTFLKLHNVGKYQVMPKSTGVLLYPLTLLGKHRYLALKAHYVACGLTTRQHGNHNRLPHLWRQRMWSGSYNLSPKSMPSSCRGGYLAIRGMIYIYFLPVPPRRYS